MIKNLIIILFNGLILAENLILSENEMLAIKSSTYCSDNGHQSWHISSNCTFLSSLSAFLKNKRLSTVWIGPGPQWQVSQGIEFVTLKDSKVSFSRTFDLNNETITKRTICVKLQNKPTVADNNETAPLIANEQIQVAKNEDKDTPNRIQERISKRSNECCCPLI